MIDTLAKTVTESETDPRLGANVMPTADPQATPEVQTPTLAETVASICRDARHDSLKYVLRSDVGHDGE